MLCACAYYCLCCCLFKRCRRRASSGPPGLGAAEPDPAHGAKQEPLLGWCHRRVRGLLTAGEVAVPWRARLHNELQQLQAAVLLAEGSVSGASHGSSEALTEVGAPLWETRVESWMPAGEDVLAAVTDCVGECAWRCSPIGTDSAAQRKLGKRVC